MNFILNLLWRRDFWGLPIFWVVQYIYNNTSCTNDNLWNLWNSKHNSLRSRNNLCRVSDFPRHSVATQTLHRGLCMSIIVTNHLCTSNCSLSPHGITSLLIWILFKIQTRSGNQPKLLDHPVVHRVETWLKYLWSLDLPKKHAGKLATLYSILALVLNKNSILYYSSQYFLCSIAFAVVFSHISM